MSVFLQIIDDYELQPAFRQFVRHIDRRTDRKTVSYLQKRVYNFKECFKCLNNFCTLPNIAGVFTVDTQKENNEIKTKFILMKKKTLKLIWNNYENNLNKKYLMKS